MLDDQADVEVGRIALELRRPVDLGPGVDQAVMAAIRAAPLMVAGRSVPTPARPARRFAWLTRSRTLRLRVSPIGTLAAAGIAIAAIFGLRRDAGRDGARERDNTGEFRAPATGEFAVPKQASGQVRDTVYVTRFVFVAPDAKQVAVVGDFNGWDTDSTHLVRHAGDGVWTVDVPLRPGRYDYAFYVDGERWVADPAAPPAVGDTFGRPSSVVTVREAQRS